MNRTDEEIHSAYKGLTYQQSVKILDEMGDHWKMEESPVGASIFIEGEGEKEGGTFFIVKVMGKKWHQVGVHHNPHEALRLAVGRLINNGWIDIEKLFE